MNWKKSATSFLSATNITVNKKQYSAFIVDANILVTSSDVTVPCALPSARVHEGNHYTMSLHLAVTTGNITIVKIIYGVYP
jgi:hypothetical protein